MKRTLLLAFTAVAALLASSCQKEELGRVLTATIEQYEHNGKAYINNENYACWENGDTVSINGIKYPISISQGNEHNYTASIQGTDDLVGQTLLAFYPASQVSRWNENNVTISLPQIQTYEEHNGHQIINNPMAAYCPADSNKLKFRNLAALLKVTIQAPNNEDLAVKTILVKGNENQMLWGSAPLILDYQNKPMLDEMSNGNATVALSFDSPAEIIANSSKSFYIVVPAASAFTNLTILVVTDPNKVYQKESRVGQALLRNQIGAFTYAPSCADVDSVSTILYEGSIEGFHSNAFGEAQVIFNEGGILIFDRPLTTIGYEAFEFCSSLSSITLPTGVTSIGNEAFEFCSSLSSITLPTGVTSIGNDAFSGCSSLSSITLPASLTSIGDVAFSGCSSLSSITLHASLTSIGKYAFSGCSSLSSITLPASLTSIGNFAFDECSSLKTVYVNRWFPREPPPDDITQGGSSMFYNCPLNEDGIYVPDDAAAHRYKNAPNWSTYAGIIKAQGSK